MLDYVVAPGATQQSDGKLVVLAAIDDDGMSDAMLRGVARTSRLVGGSEVHLIHVITDVRALPAPLHVSGAVNEALAAGQDKLELAARRIEPECPRSRIVAHLAGGEAWREIVAVADRIHADVIVVGTHGRKGLSRVMMGSVAERVVRGARCPVLVMRDAPVAPSRAEKV
jgi:nucleotide-binding universal stress UspA family protein